MPNARTPNPEPDPVHQRVDDDLERRDLRRRRLRIVATASRRRDPRRTCGGCPTSVVGVALVPAERPLRRIQRVDLLAALEDRDVRRHHLLLAVVVHLDAVVAKRVACRRSLLRPASARPARRSCRRCPAKPEADQHDAEVDDVAAVAPLVAADQADERREEIRAGVLPADVRAAPELLHDRAADDTRTARSTGRTPRSAARAPSARRPSRRPRAPATSN